MNRRHNLRRWTLTAAVAAVGLGLSFSRPAFSQYHIDTNEGHILDANNRLGSGGFNTPGVGYSQSANSTLNSIYLGESTGYSGFHGVVPSSRLGQFQGIEPASPSLQLLQQSGTYNPAAPPTYNQAAPFYSQLNQTYAPAGYMAAQGGVFQPAPSNVRQPQDYRLGVIPGETAAVPLNAPGDLGPGAVDPTADMTPSYLLNNSPLYGARAVNMAAGNAYAPTNSQFPETLTADDIIRMRSELSQSATPWLNPADQQANQQNAQQANVIPGPAAAPGAVPTSLAVPVANPVVGPTNLSANAAISAALPLNTTGALPTQAQPNRLILPTPEQQSPQYAKLHALLEQYQATHPQANVEAEKLFEESLIARREFEQSQHKPTNGKTPATLGTPSAAPAKNPTPTAPPPPPVNIGSIGHAITASGLSQLIVQGEELSRHQQYKDAIAKFLDARQVAPNNMLISVDLANAELGAGFYEQAEGYLRDAFLTDPALMLGRYDVKSVIGDQRIQVVIGDLKDIAKNNDNSTPIFLLAYLSYNTGEPDKALEYLKLAQSRAGGNDELFKQLIDHWSGNPATQPAQ